MSRLFWWIFDLVFLAGTLAVLAIAITGGGELVLNGTRLSFHGVGNGLIGLYALGTVRFLFRHRAAFLGIPTLPLSAIDRRAIDVVLWVRRQLSRLTSRNTALVLGIFLVFGLTVRLANAWAHPGFFSGDDVEVQEMSFARLFGWDWSAWNLRSPFYPLGFIYPVQTLLSSTGVDDTRSLVFAGRAVVAILSSFGIILVYWIVRGSLGRPAAVLAAAFVTFSGLSVSFGSTELPRPIAAVFVLVAFGLLQERRSAPLLAGAAVGIAAAMRFSEIVFVIPGALQLLREGRHRTLVVFVAATAVTAAGIQAGCDYFNWGHPFSSVREMVDFTIAHGGSTRGYQPLWHYLVAVTDWTDFAVFALAVYATSRQTWRLGLWAWTPIVVLSLLPHKESRYLLPALPFVAALAAVGLWRISAVVANPEGARPPGRLAIWIVAGMCGSLVFQVSQMHVRRTDAAVRFASELARNAQIDVLAIEQHWGMGNRLYLRLVRNLVRLDSEHLRNQGDLLEMVRRTNASWIALSQDTCRRVNCGAVLTSTDYAQVLTMPDADTSNYIVYRTQH